MAETTKPDGLDVARFMSAHGITQITVIPEQTIMGLDWPQQYSLVIGNSRWFGRSVSEAVEKAQ